MSRISHLSEAQQIAVRAHQDQVLAYLEDPFTDFREDEMRRYVRKFLEITK